VSSICLVAVLAIAPTPAFATETEASPSEIITDVSEASGISGTEQDPLAGISTDESGDWGSDYQEDLIDSSGIHLSSSTSGFSYVESGSESDLVGIRPVVHDSVEWNTESSGLASVDGNPTYEIARAAKEDGTLQYAAILESSAAPEQLTYQLDLPAGAYSERVGDAILLYNAEGDVLGGFTPPWAKDSSGTDIPTSYRLEGSTLIQTVTHRDLAGVSYPVVADPAYAGGMIKRVNHEYWSNGGWIVQVEVTALARYTWGYNPSLVAQKGYNDLLRHHPRSMSIPTMAQQWDCHVLGLMGTYKIDLESYRSSKPGWRYTEIYQGVLAAIRARDIRAVAAACNWR
jgi:hypothetical protein